MMNVFFKKLFYSILKKELTTLFIVRTLHQICSRKIRFCRYTPTSLFNFVHTVGGRGRFQKKWRMSWWPGDKKIEVMLGLVPRWIRDAKQKPHYKSIHGQISLGSQKGSHRREKAPWGPPSNLAGLRCYSQYQWCKLNWDQVYLFYAVFIS